MVSAPSAKPSRLLSTTAKEEMRPVLPSAPICTGRPTNGVPHLVPQTTEIKAGGMSTNVVSSAASQLQGCCGMMVYRTEGGLGPYRTQAWDASLMLVL